MLLQGPLWTQPAADVVNSTLGNLDNDPGVTLHDSPLLAKDSMLWRENM